jgi:hypothetical protein
MILGKRHPDKGGASIVNKNSRFYGIEVHGRHGIDGSDHLIAELDEDQQIDKA